MIKKPLSSSRGEAAALFFVCFVHALYCVGQSGDGNESAKKEKTKRSIKLNAKIYLHLIERWR